VPGDGNPSGAQGRSVMGESPLTAVLKRHPDIVSCTLTSFTGKKRELYCTCLSTKLDVSDVFQIQENRRHETDGRTDGLGATLNAAPSEERMITGTRLGKF